MVDLYKMNDSLQALEIGVGEGAFGGLMSFEMFRERFEQLSSNGKIVHVMGGDLLAHPELKQILLFLRENGGSWFLDTNARRLSFPRLARACVRSGLVGAQVDLVSANSEVYDIKVGVRGAFQEAVAGIANLRKLKLDVRLSVILSPENLRGLNGLVSLAHSLDVGLSFRWPERPGASESLNIPEVSRSVRNAFSLAMVQYGWEETRFEVVDIPRCLVPEALMTVRGSAAFSAQRSAQCGQCTLKGECPGPTSEQLNSGISEHLRPFFPEPAGFEFESVANRNLEIQDLKTCALRKPDAERPALEDVMIRTEKDGEFAVYAAKTKVPPSVAVLKNLMGYAVSPVNPDEVLSLDTNCRGCRVLTQCGAVFSSAEVNPDLPMDRDSGKPQAKHRVLECGSSAELSRSLLSRLHEGEGHGVIRGRLPLAGAAPNGKTVGPNGIFRAILGQPWKVEEVRLPDRNSNGFFEVELRAVEGAGSAGMHNLAAVALLKRCNLRCIMCQIPVLYPESDVPPLDLFRTFFELRLHGFDWLTTFGGEPLLRADLEGLVSSARSLGFGVDMVTNGSYLTEARAQSMVDAGLNFCMVSVDGATADTHDVVRAKKGSFDEAVQGLKNFRKQAPGARLELNSVIVQENKHQLADLVSLVSDLEVKRANLFLCVSAPVLAPEPHWLDVPSLKKILEVELPDLRDSALEEGIELTMSPGFPEGRLDEFIQEAAGGVYNLYHKSGTRCQAPDKEIFISVKQEVYGCASPTVLESSTALGSLAVQSLGKIYKSKEAIQYSTKAADHEPCKMCWRCDPELSERKA